MRMYANLAKNHQSSAVTRRRWNEKLQKLKHLQEGPN